MKGIITRFLFVSVSTIVVSLWSPLRGSAEIDLKNVVGIWTFDEGTGDLAKDISLKRNHGKLIAPKRNDPPKWVKGKFGQALEFDGQPYFGNYVDMGDPADGSLDFGKNDFSVTWWFKTTALGKYMVSKKAAGHFDAGFHANLDGPRGNLRILLADGKIDASVDGETGNLHNDKWHHGAFVRSGDKLQVYVDGRANNSTAGVVNLDISSTTNFYAGRENNGNKRYPGLLDDLAAFSVALTEDEIKEIMNEGLREVVPTAAVSPKGKLATAWGAIKAR